MSIANPSGELGSGNKQRDAAKTIKDIDWGRPHTWNEIIVCDRLELQAVPRTSHKPEKKIGRQEDEFACQWNGRRWVGRVLPMRVRPPVILRRGIGLPRALAPCSCPWPSGFQGAQPRPEATPSNCVEAWRLVNQRLTWTPDRSRRFRWRQLRQKATWSNRFETSAAAYRRHPPHARAAWRSLHPVLRPVDYQGAALSSTEAASAALAPPARPQPRPGRGSWQSQPIEGSPAAAGGQS